eukprot:TRINITY_DN1309_c0_g1_i2.p2 TRINITY_DN1309_c0_g1~~TRINITY_DN1309_c0_g1_i2.p2  ORF type:complete len:246 (+),score=23.79 TRINITY_DN1309_c0_g1_i2:122-859(+)
MADVQCSLNNFEVSAKRYLEHVAKVHSQLQASQKCTVQEKNDRIDQLQQQEKILQQRSLEKNSLIAQKQQELDELGNLFNKLYVTESQELPNQLHSLELELEIQQDEYNQEQLQIEDLEQEAKHYLSRKSRKVDIVSKSLGLEQRQQLQQGRSYLKLVFTHIDQEQPEKEFVVGISRSYEKENPGKQQYVLIEQSPIIPEVDRLLSQLNEHPRELRKFVIQVRQAFFQLVQQQKLTSNQHNIDQN